jgi:hypothetical protein
MATSGMSLPPLWRLRELFDLSDKYPSGLEWRIDRAGYKAGDQVGRINIRTGYYMVFVDNKRYLAHRIVCFMRTERDLTNSRVLHHKSNTEKDNREPLLISNVVKKISTEELG